MQLPREFVELIDSYGCEEFAGLAEALAGKPSVAMRLNPRKASGRSPSGDARRVPWCENGFLLDERMAFTFDPALHQGAFYVQDASSMFIHHIIKYLTRDSDRPLSVLDACAAPGGKTTAIIDALPWGSLVVANEYDGRRAQILKENLAKWGYPFVLVMQGDTAQFRKFPNIFDIVAADVPCSGEGMMRKDETAVEQWTRGLVEQCAARQREIVGNLWGALKPGGYFIYSTCTFNRDENELMIEYMAREFGAEPVMVPVDDSWGIVGAIDSMMPAYRFLPGRIEGEGLFMAVMRKPGDEEVVRKSTKSDGKKSRKKKQTAEMDVDAGVKNWITAPAQWSIEDGKVIATLESPGILKPVIVVGNVKGRDIIPSQDLAMSMLLNREAFAHAEVSRETAIDYLRCEAVTLPDATPRGIVLLTYSGQPLGFAKNLGNRANNLYPHKWRIISQRPVPLPGAVLQPQG